MLGMMALHLKLQRMQLYVQVHLEERFKLNAAYGQYSFTIFDSLA